MRYLICLSLVCFIGCRYLEAPFGYGASAPDGSSEVVTESVPKGTRSASSSATAKDPKPNPSAVSESEDYAVVKTFFATDRNQTASSAPSEIFGKKRSHLSYGTCEVSIPRDHRMGELEKPSVLKLEFKEDPSKHVMVMDVSVQPKEQFFQQVSERLNQSPERKTFIFVHGYNVTFEDAARRTAQMSYDLGFAGAPVFYSWPSQGMKSMYMIDEQNIEWTMSNLRQFLAEYIDYSGSQQIYLIGHSMGNRALVRAVGSLPKAYQERIHEIILAAPDIDADVFKRDIAPALVQAGRPITLYTSSKDMALKASNKLHGADRIGENAMVIPGIETVDAAEVNSSFLGHSYPMDNTSVISDIYYIINEGQRANSRFGLRPVQTATGSYWKFKR